MKRQNLWSQLKLKSTYIFIGISATLWFLLRVIPKPSRASYPCMQVAAPIMSAFVVYLLSISTAIFSFKKFKQSFRASKYAVGLIFLSLFAISTTFLFIHGSQEGFANPFATLDTSFPVPSNEPIGQATGLFPGRVVWVHDLDATNENFVPEAGSNDFWYTNLNTDEQAVQKMLAIAIAKYAGKDDVTEAWDAIFKWFNNTHGRGEVGYTAGEKIAIKLNITNGGGTENRMDATPQLVKAIIYQLVNKAGVLESDITLGDPYREFNQQYRDAVMTEYPDVYYVDGNGGDGVFQTIPSSTSVLKFSDGLYTSTLPQHYLDATYVINIPCLKTHSAGGITLIAKNHQGSYLEKGDAPETQYAIKMHYSLPRKSAGVGKYRLTVDYMGHKETGGKGLIYIIDGIWGGEDWMGWIKKFKSDPFNDDYPNSIFVGQDPVALESVCFDVLFQENVVDGLKEKNPIELKTEIADYLKQCASKDYWPSGITYDPEGDGTAIGSLGVFEHWNNATNRQYTRNLQTGNGIELNYYLVDYSTKVQDTKINRDIAAPNPFSTYIEFKNPDKNSINSTLTIYDANGKMVQSFSFKNRDAIVWDGRSLNGNFLPNGLYIYKINNTLNQPIFTGKIILKK